jgi:hypothetical protein
MGQGPGSRAEPSGDILCRTIHVYRRKGIEIFMPKNGLIASEFGLDLLEICDPLL